MGLFCRNKMLRPVWVMVFNGTHSVFLVSVVTVTFGRIWPWFRTARQQFLHGPAPVRGPIFDDPCVCRQLARCRDVTKMR